MRTIGIDLGTTNTVVASDGTVVPQGPESDAQRALASVVAFPPSGATVVGATAKKRRAIDPKNTIFSAKRLMGQGFRAYATARFREQYPFELIDQNGQPAFKTRSGAFSPAQIAAKIIGKATQHLPHATDARMVITVPAAFDDAARRATTKAAALAGAKHVTLVSEPIATATAYVVTQAGLAKRAAVYDLGGGTFDLAVVDCTGPELRVLAHGGDPYLGGDDVDRAVAEWAAGEVLKAHGWDLGRDPIVLDRLIMQCERAKLRLGFAQEARIDLAQVDPAAPAATHHVVLSRDRLDQLCRELVGRTFSVCDEVLHAAGVHVRDIDAVFLSGGSTLLPLVRDGVAKYFGSLPRCDHDPMEVVAVGASLSSA